MDNRNNAQANNAQTNNSGRQQTSSGWGTGFFGAVTNRFSNATNKAGDAFNKRGMTIALIVLTFVAIVIIIVYIIYRVRNKDLRSVIVIHKPLKLFDMDEPVKFEKDKIPPTMNGQEFSYSFWLYLVDYEEVSSDHRLLFMRNDDSGLAGASPVVFLDGRTNKMYVAFKTNQSKEDIDSLDDLLPDKNIDNGVLTGVFEYVPLQRWVHFMITVQDNLVMMYQDGDIYSVQNVHDLWDGSRSGNRPILSGTAGDVHVGKRDGSDTPTYGFISNLVFNNHALPQHSVQRMYVYGPIPRSSGGGFTNKYGLRNPIYKRDATS